MDDRYSSLDPARLAMLDPRSTAALESWLTVASSRGLEEARKLCTAWHSAAVEEEEEEEEEPFGRSMTTRCGITVRRTRWTRAVRITRPRPAARHRNGTGSTSPCPTSTAETSVATA